VLLLIALALAVFVLPSPWGLVAVVIGATLELAETTLFIWWSKRRKASVGVESLGQVRVSGEIWKARCAGGCDPGTSVVVRRIDGLVLEVDPA
jgi:NfeD-like C-terminal, partner-binding